jgi:hypothetical protein
MDKINQYQNTIINFLHFYNESTGGEQERRSVTRRIILDKENNSFQLLSVGWNGKHFIFSPIFHFDIIDGKIWMQCNNTEWEAVDYLMGHGVDRQDIVLGFVPPEARQYSGFAVA